MSDPVAQGFVSNLAHPGDNITGFFAFEPSIAGKWLDLLKQVASQRVSDNRATRRSSGFTPASRHGSARLKGPFGAHERHSHVVLTASICLDTGRLDDRPPLFDFGLLVCAECFRTLLLE